MTATWRRKTAATRLPEEPAVAPYVQALTDSGRRATLLHEAPGLIDGFTPEIRSKHDVRAVARAFQRHIGADH